MGGEQARREGATEGPADAGATPAASTKAILASIKTARSHAQECLRIVDELFPEDNRKVQGPVVVRYYEGARGD